jgi:hypothetical protein
LIDIRASAYPKKVDPYSPEVINKYDEQPIRGQGQVVLTDRQERFLTAIVDHIPHRERETFRTQVFNHLAAGTPGDQALKRAIHLEMISLGYTSEQLQSLGIAQKFTSRNGPKSKDARGDAIF